MIFKQPLTIVSKQFSNRLVRDLAWVISSPPLVSGSINNVRWWNPKECLNEYHDCLPALCELDKNPQQLLDHMNQLNSGRLGLRFEAFIAYWLNLSPNYELLDKNIQIIEEGHTFGEIDFIIKELKTEKIIHLEVAVKFYLGSPPYENLFNWFGTNTNDQLGKKLEHLKRHQTQLSQKYSSHFPHPIDEMHCFLKGRLFYPVDIETTPKSVNANHLRGRWVQATTHFEHNLLIPIDKKKWLSELVNEDIQEDMLQTEFSNKSHPHCYALIEKNKESTHKEKGRVFYLPRHFTFPGST